MGVADVQDELVALLGGTIANAVDFERLLVAIGDADDHVVQQSAGQAVQSAVLLTVVGTGNEKLSAFLLDGHARLELLGQGTLGALDGDKVAVRDGDFDTRGNGNGHFTNSTHCFIPSLPHERKDFAADVSRASSLVGHNALGGGDDGNTEATEHAGQFICADVNAETGLADTAKAGDDLVLAIVLQGDVDRALGTIVNDLIALDVALVQQNLSDALLHVGSRDINGVVLCTVGVADAGQHIRNRIGDMHGKSSYF